MTHPPQPPRHAESYRAVPPEDPPPARTAWHQRGAVRALIAAAIFVIGLFVGGVIVGFTVSGPAPKIPTRTVTATPPPQAAPSSQGAVTGLASVNQQCLQAINDTQSSLGALQNLADALRSLNPVRIDEAIRRLQPIQQRIRDELKQCKVTTSVAGNRSAVPAPAPSTG